jgi:hypothetical protein
MEDRGETVNGTTSTDATRGLPLGERVCTRVTELETVLANLDDEHETIERSAIELALAGARELATAREQDRWLEANKYLGETPEKGDHRA